MTMEDVNNVSAKYYQLLLDSVFGNGILQVPLKGESNNVIGALSHKGDYDVFKSNFKLLLEDLKNKYNIDSIRQALIQVADSKNWEGAYAELVALSVLNNNYSGEIKTDITLKEGMGFAIECGQSLTNEDGFWADLGAYFDVKILSDPIKEILDGIINRAIKKVNPPETCNILAEYPMDDDDVDYKSNIAQIEKELVKALQEKKTVIHISILQKLMFRIHWGGGMNSVVMAYSPFRHAENTKDIVLKRYVKKLLKRKPFFLIFVNFPWFNQLVKDSFDMNKWYYRALARRTFMQYEHSRAKANEIISGYKGDETKRSLARCLSGIVFIEDHSILKTKDKYQTYVYLNPNARNQRSIMKSYLEQLPNQMFEDFENDNY